MNVTIAPHDVQYAINKIYTAARTCYSNESPEVIFRESISKPREEMMKTILHCLRSGHHSVLEHVSFTFFISGVSRALTHQLVRHRLASYSQQSQRYCKVDESGFQYVTPTTIVNNEKALEEYDRCMQVISKCYNNLVQYGVPAEDARYVLPNGAYTNITMSLNLRQFIHLCNERLCTTAQWEIRHMVHLMREQLKIFMGPELMNYFEPKCKALGYCPESKKRSCGIRKTREEVIGS